MPASLFFPGDTPASRHTSDNGRPRSRWREDAFIYRQVQRAIMPTYGLAQAIRDWHEIVRDLADTPRRRPRQTSRLKAALDDQN